VNQEESEQNEVNVMKKNADSTSDAYLKEPSVICDEEHTYCQAKVTTNKQLHEI